MGSQRSVSLVLVFATIACEHDGPNEAAPVETPRVVSAARRVEPAQPQALADDESLLWRRSEARHDRESAYKWDQSHLGWLLENWKHLQCYRDHVKDVGEAGFGAEPGSPREEQWLQNRHRLVLHLDRWYERLIAEEPDVSSQSEFFSSFKTAYVLVLQTYPAAYNESDRQRIRQADQAWKTAQAQVAAYVGRLGGAKDRATDSTPEALLMPSDCSVVLRAIGRP